MYVFTHWEFTAVYSTTSQVELEMLSFSQVHVMNGGGMECWEETLIVNTPTIMSAIVCVIVVYITHDRDVRQRITGSKSFLKLVKCFRGHCVVTPPKCETGLVVTLFCSWAFTFT